MHSKFVVVALFAVACHRGEGGGRDAADRPDGPAAPDAALPDAGTPAPKEACAPAELTPCTARPGSASADGVILRGTVVAIDELYCSGDVLYSRSQGRVLCV